MKCTDTERSRLTPFTIGCVSAVIATLVPAATAQVANIEPAPQSVFDTDREEGLAKYFSAGPMSVRPHLYMTTYYDDNVALQHRAEREDLVWRFSPGVLFGMGEFRGDKGNYLSLDYTPTLSLYSKYSTYNSLDHHVVFDAGWKLAKLTLGISQAYQIESGKQTEAAAFVEQETFTTLITSKYELSDKTSFDLNGRQSLISTEEDGVPGPDDDLVSINEWVIEGWGNYKTTEKLVLGLGATFGWRDIRDFVEPDDVNEPDSPNQTFQQGLVRALYHATEKLDFRGSAGFQFSQFQEGDNDGPIFVFNIGSSWQAMENTSVALDAYRQDRPSYTFNGQNYTATGLRASIRHQFLEKYTAVLAAGYENSDYSDVAGPSSGLDRNDDYFWLRPSLDYQFDDHWSAGIFYQFRRKNSDVGRPDFAPSAFDFTNNQLGIYSNYRF